MRKFAFILAVLILCILVSPMFVYWWGLSNLSTHPTPSSILLDQETENTIWRQEFGEGKPRVKVLNPYTYIYHIYWCTTKTVPHSTRCQSKFPGIRLAAFAVRNQVAEQIHGKGNTMWYFTWMSYSIWVTRNWDIHQIIATYHEEKST